MGNGNTAHSSRKRLSEFLRGIIQWMSRPYLVRRTKISWTRSHLSVIIDYYLKVEAINPSCCEQICRNISFCEVWHRRFETQNSIRFASMVATLMAELQELFHVPRLQHDHSSDKSELLAIFISFLLELLDHETEFTVLFKDQIFCLKKELRFLVTIHGDTPFEGTDGDHELEGVKKLLAEFEAVANQAGTLVCSFIFTTKELFESRRTGEALSVLLKHIGLLKANIIKFSGSLPDNIKPKTCAVESTFIVDSVLCDLEDLMNRRDDPLFDVKDQIKVLYEGLALSQSLLKDIKLEIKELNELAVRARDVAYEVEYLIKNFLIGDAPVWYLTVRLPHVIHKIELIGTGLQEIKKTFDNGGLQVGEIIVGAQLLLQPKRNPDAHEIMVGFEEAATNILDQLVGGTKHLQIVCIFGMPGIGKTTFAKKLYNHPFVSYHFDKCSWCVVSQTYQKKFLLIDILASLDPKLDKVRILNMEEDNLAERIYKSLKGKRYLITMDDVWDTNLWENFRKYFPNDGNGSRILFTSRINDVAPPNSIIYALPPLSNSQCWELLERKVFQNNHCPPQLLGIGKEIAAKCNGLPLSVVVIAGILSAMDMEVSTWGNVAKRLALYILSGQNNAVVQTLKLSYKHLPKHLKPCFLYFGAFSEDKEIPVKKLKWLWIAEGFILKQANKSAEAVAEEYLMQLIDKSLIIVAKRRSDGGIKACVVHDLLRDLCLRIAEEENFSKVIYNGFSVYNKHHRLYVCKDSFHGAHFGLFGFQVRSFFCYLKSISLCLGDMKLLRVLNLPNYSLDNHGGGIELVPVHLRYLAVRSAWVELVGHLVNLEVLILTNGTIHLSSVIQKMVKLRYLSAYKVIFGQEWNSSHTNHIEFLSCVDILKLKDEEMLRCSPHLRKLKCKCAPFVDKQGAYRYPDLRFLTQLESLHMTTFRGDKMAEIKLPCNIEKLTLSGLGLSWEKMSIIRELSNLQVLKLESDAFVGEAWETRDGEFQKLIFLKLNNLNIAQWNVASGEHFPKLQQLVLHRCYRLQEIPCEISEIATLQLIEVELCSKAVAESARKIQQEQLDMGIEDLTVIV